MLPRSPELTPLLKLGHLDAEHPFYQIPHSSLCIIVSFLTLVRLKNISMQNIHFISMQNIFFYQNFAKFEIVQHNFILFFDAEQNFAKKFAAAKAVKRIFSTPFKLESYIFGSLCISNIVGILCFPKRESH